MADQYDLIVIGAGPGGYVAAIKAAQLGKKTAIIENREIGGTCLNRGCIPTKTIMHSSHLYYEALNLENTGIQISGISYDMNKIIDRKDEVVDKIQKGILGLLKENGVTIITGTATILDSNYVQVNHFPPDQLKQDKVDTNDKQIIKTDKILIATGSKPAIPPIQGVKLNNVVTSDELLNMRDKIYHKLVIIGGGVIGVEFATIYQELGCEVEIIEALDRILPTMDKEISQSVAMSLKKKGIKIHTKAKVIQIKETTDNEEYGLYCEYEESGTALKTAAAEGILISVGRKANTQGLFAPEISILMERDKIKIDSNFETNIKGIYAIGDVIGGIQLAHAASAQGIVAVEGMFNEIPTINLNVIPSCIYTSPEVASVGLEEEEAKDKGYDIKTGKYPLLGNSKTILSMDERGYIKIISDSKTGKIIGAQLICARATDMVGELATAIVNGLTVRDLAAVIRPHPTYSEGITEAVNDIAGYAIHLLPKYRKNQ